MAYIEWNEALSVGVAKIDDDHRKIIDSINSLHRAMSENRGQEYQQKVIAEMCTYASSHFALEEGYMRQVGFPELDDHGREHEKFTRFAADLKARADQGKLILTMFILSFLKDWLSNHIMGTDMKYVDHFRRHGIAD